MKLSHRRRLYVLALCAVSIIVIFINNLIFSTHGYKQDQGLVRVLDVNTVQGHSRVLNGATFVHLQESVPVHPACDLVRNIFFLKTHKTGSSTIFNILFRFADEYDRTVAIPRIHGNLMNYPELFQESFMFNYSVINRRVEIFAVHSRLNINEVQRIMPPKTKFITILRHPLYAWESAYDYFRISSKTNLSIESFAFNDSAIQMMRGRKISSWFGFNMMYFDMGFEENVSSADAFGLTGVSGAIRNIITLVLQLIAILVDRLHNNQKHAVWLLNDYASVTSCINQRSIQRWLQSAYSPDLRRIFMEFFVPQNKFQETAEVQAQKAISMLEQNFHLVLLAEFMEESLVLLREELCWKLESMVAFRHNERNLSIRIQIMSSEAEARILYLNDIDMRIYKHFLEKFLHLLDKFGRGRMFNEVQALKLRNRFWSDICIAERKQGILNTIEFVPGQEVPSICDRLTLKEVHYIRKFRTRYISELWWNFRKRRRPRLRRKNRKSDIVSRNRQGHKDPKGRV
ncbi:galactose-3-O-sulfotransferase 2-like [Varroa jacobsoni]|uniref:galactose-3-O-sulfotransferase 2-like n=1 Tax=Varroa jacobsoni TaxID=62625 RepID=UPI000BF8C4FF|nr:galactose-3-O-sulfotransferase 2-like [Varroa jacobsoni]